MLKERPSADLASRNKCRDLMKFLKDLKRSAKTHFNVPDEIGVNKSRADFFRNWIDHGFIRRFWTNIDEIYPSIWRGNHPPTERFRSLKGIQINTVINLRGSKNTPFYREEASLCEELGFDLISISFSASRAPEKSSLVQLLDAFDQAKRPIFMHCKSGADRAGLASAIFLIVHTNTTPDLAKKMLSLRYLHLKWSRTGILDRFLMTYLACNATEPIPFRVWVEKCYDPLALEEEFHRHRLKNVLPCRCKDVSKTVKA